MKKRIALLILLLPGLILLGTLGLLNSESGSRWLLERLLSTLPAQTTFARMEGSLLRQVSLSELQYQSPTESIRVARLNFSWQPRQLLAGRLKIVEISLDDVDIVIKHPSKTSEDGGFDWNAEFPLPLQLILEKLSVTNLRYQAGDTQIELQHLNISALTQKDRLELTALTLAAKPFSAQAHGVMQIGKRFPFKLQTNWRLDTEEYGQWQTNTHIEGDAERLLITSHQSSPFVLDVQGELEQLQSLPQFQLRGDWRQLNWPPVATPAQISSEQGYFAVSGTTDDYRLTLSAPLTQPYLPQAQLQFSSQGNRTGIRIEDLRIDSEAGAFQLNGQVNWQDDTSFALNASGKNFNPAIVTPQLPGSLTFQARLNGKIGESVKQLHAEIDRLDGQLRGNPVQAHGRLSLANDDITLDKLTLKSGRNRIDIDGTWGPEDSNLEFSMDAPALVGLWPGLQGSFKGDGQVRGSRQNLVARFKARGNGLRFDQYRIGKLGLDLDYAAALNARSNLQLNASAIEIGSQAIQSLRMSGSGNAKRHQLELTLRSPLAALSCHVSGELRETRWQANLSKLTIEHSQTGPWQLRAPVKIAVEQQGAGLTANLGEICLIRQAASLCGQGNYHAAGDFDLLLRAAALPTELLQPYLADDWRLVGVLNAEAELKRQQGRLSGGYRLEMPAEAKLIAKEADKATELNLGKLTINGQLKDTLLASDVDLALIGDDYLRAQLQLDTRPSGALSGHIAAAVDDWALVQPFIPGEAEIKGQLLADIHLRGSAPSPRISGNVRLQDGAISLPNLGMALHAINLRAQAAEDGGDRIQLDGNFIPAWLATADSPGRPEFNGRIEVTAALQQTQKQWRGDYRLDLPANSSISLETAETRLKVPFAASSLSGSFEPDHVSARLDVRMNQQDFLLSQLQIDNGQTISGQVNASIRDLGLFDALLPDLNAIRGLIKADLLIQGTIEQPTAIGSIGLTQGAAEVSAVGIALRELELQLDATQGQSENLKISGRALSGKGMLTIQGLADLKGNADISLRGTDFELVKLTEAQVEVSPALHLKATPTHAKVDGRLDIPKAIITLTELPENAVTVSEDETILGQTETAKKPASAPDLDANIDIELGKQVSFSGQGLNTDLAGRLKLIKTGQQTDLHGSIDMKNGHYKSYGQDLTIRKGRFLFNGPADSPWLDVEATRLSKSKEVTAILNLSGPLKSPKTRIYSEPSLPESDALAYLITGSPLNQVGKSDGNMVASAAIAYGMGQLSWLTTHLGVDEFDVEQGSALQDTLVTMGKYLTPDFYVGTRLNIFNKQAVLVLKHKLTNTLNVETQSGTSQRIKLNYEVETD